MRRIGVVLVAASLATAVALPNALAAVTAVPDGKFGSLGDNIYNTTGLGQTKRVKVRPGHTVKVPFQAQNDASVLDHLRVDGDAGSPPFSVQYKVGSTDVTADVEAGTYLTPSLSTGNAQALDLFIKAKPSASHGEHETFSITIPSDVSKGTVTDVIRVKARVR